MSDQEGRIKRGLPWSRHLFGKGDRWTLVTKESGKETFLRFQVRVRAILQNEQNCQTVQPMSFFLFLSPLHLGDGTKADKEKEGRKRHCGPGSSSAKRGRRKKKLSGLSLSARAAHRREKSGIYDAMRQNPHWYNTRYVYEHFWEAGREGEASTEAKLVHKKVGETWNSQGQEERKSQRSSGERQSLQRMSFSLSPSLTLSLTCFSLLLPN